MKRPKRSGVDQSAGRIASFTSTVTSPSAGRCGASSARQVYTSHLSDAQSQWRRASPKRLSASPVSGPRKLVRGHNGASSLRIGSGGCYEPCARMPCSCSGRTRASRSTSKVAGATKSTAPRTDTEFLDAQRSKVARQSTVTTFPKVSARIGRRRASRTWPALYGRPTDGFNDGFRVSYIRS